MKIDETIVNGMDIVSPIITKLAPLKPKKATIKKSIKTNS